MRLSEFVGNENAKARVASMFESGRLPHAILIEGAVGSGRHTLARIIAQHAACTGGVSPCGQCAACLSGDANPDIVTVVSNKANITVDIIRSVRNEAYVKPNQSARKVFIIPDAQIMNHQAQNALLKVLEEPPADVMFILTCEYAMQLLETIVSRVSIISLSAPERDEAVEYICSKYPQYTAEQTQVAFESTIGVALERLAGTAGYVSSALEAAALLLESELKLHKYMRKFEKDRKAQREICSAMQDIFHSALVMRMSGADAGADDVRTELSRRFTSKQLVELSRVCSRAKADCELNMGATLFITNFCARLERAVE